MFELDLRSRKSIYEQIMDNLKELIMSEKLPFGTKLPSVRDLSKQISVNPNTVQKAFAELIRAGVIFSVAGKGNYISPDAMDIKRDEKAEILKELRYIARRAKISGIWMDELITVLDSSYNE